MKTCFGKFTHLLILPAAAQLKLKSSKREQQVQQARSLCFYSFLKIVFLWTFLFLWIFVFLDLLFEIIPSWELKGRTLLWSRTLNAYVTFKIQLWGWLLCSRYVYSNECKRAWHFCIVVKRLTCSVSGVSRPPTPITLAHDPDRQGLNGEECNWQCVWSPVHTQPPLCYISITVTPLPSTQANKVLKHQVVRYATLAKWGEFQYTLPHSSGANCIHTPTEQ